MIEIYIPMFVTSLLSFISGYQMFVGIEKKLKKIVGINSCVTICNLPIFKVHRIL